jgi:hypothetical protein
MPGMDVRDDRIRPQERPEIGHDAVDLHLASPHHASDDNSEQQRRRHRRERMRPHDVFDIVRRIGQFALQLAEKLFRIDSSFGAGLVAGRIRRARGARLGCRTRQLGRKLTELGAVGIAFGHGVTFLASA